MANFQVTDAAGNTKYLKATGAGTDIDPQVIHRSIDVIAAGDNNIGNVDVLTVIPGTAATNLGKAEDAAHTTGDTGVMALAVRKDTATALAGTDGDYIPLITDNAGKLHVNTGIVTPAALGANGGLKIEGVASGTVVPVILPAGELHLGQVTGGATTIAQTPTITAGAYDAKDAVGGLLTFAGAARVSGGCGRINTVTIIDLGDVKADLELWLFDQTFTATADNAAFDPSDADLANCIGVIPIPTANYHSAADNGVGCVRLVGFDYKCAASSLFGQIKCVGTPSYAATGGLTIKLSVEYTN